MIDVTVVLVEGGAPSTAVAPVEVFTSAGVLWNTLHGVPEQPHFQVRTVSLEGRPVQTGFGMNLHPDGRIEDVCSTDVVVIAAVSVDVETICPAYAPLYPWLRERYQRGTLIAGACSGVALIAESGILDECCATTHWGVVDSCRRRFPRVRWQPERILTDSNGIVCGGGVYAAVDMSLYVVEKLIGHKAAMETAKALILETPRTWQIGYSADPPAFDHADAQIARVQEWLFHHFDEWISIDALAARANMSPRTFARRFKRATGQTSTKYLQTLRVNVARHLLESDLRSVQDVSYAVGYEDVKFFRTLFKRYTGRTPQQYRARFAVDPPEHAEPAGRQPHPENWAGDR